MKHDKLVPFRSTLVTPDVEKAMQKLEKAAVEHGGVKIHYSGTPAQEANWQGEAGPTGLPPHLSMRMAGRELGLRVSLTDFDGDVGTRKELELAILWGLAVPLGFTPWQRYPVPGTHDHIFHFLGPWSHVIDSLHGEGRGEWAWPSACAAAQSVVGRWEGGQPTERLIQAHLHRLGINCGPVDGEVGERTLSALRALGLGGMPTAEIAKAVAKMKTPRPSPKAAKVGHVILPGGSQAFTSGEVRSMRTKTGYTLSCDGPGKVILMIEGS